MLVLKGDVNYRRLLEDRHWPPTTRLEEVTQFMPTSTLSLRTLKAEIMVGLAEGKPRGWTARTRPGASMGAAA